MERQYRHIRFREKASLKEYVLHNATCVFRKGKKKAFAAFVREQLKTTKTVAALAEMTDMDEVIVGSDQVFNPLCTNGDPAYLLKGLPEGVKKIAYAASIGKKENIDLYESRFGVDYKKELQDFSWISTREADAAQYLCEATGKKCDCMLDPVLLYGAEGWREFCKETAEEYIFVYNLGNFPTLFETVKRIKKLTGLKVIILNKDIKGDLKSLGFDIRSNAAPQEFVSLLANARYVVTDSFHATAFSIMFHRDFYVVANGSRNNTNSRLQNVLNEFGIEGRYLTSAKNFSCADKVDYDDGKMLEKCSQAKAALAAALSANAGV